MKVVIDISEEDYKKVQDGRASVAMMRDAIKNAHLCLRDMETSLMLTSYTRILKIEACPMKVN